MPSLRRARLCLEALESRDVPTTFSAAQLDGAGQYLLEMINRARADPAAEAARDGIDLNEGLAPGTISAAPKQPLAPNSALMSAINAHLAVWMSSTAFWSVDGGAGAPSPHSGLGDGTPGSRIAAAGYASANEWGENVAAQWQTNPVADLEGVVTQMEQGLFVDTYVTGRGHRLNLLNPDFQEAGVALASGLKPAGQYTGSNLVLAGQDFAVDAGAPAAGDPSRANLSAGGFVTGVVYQDADGNGQYDVGEGLGGNGLRVSWQPADPAAAAWNAGGSALVADSGGYRTAKLAPGAWIVTFDSGPLAAPESFTINVGTANVKLDDVVPAGSLQQPTPPPVIAPVPNQTSNAFAPVALQINAPTADHFNATSLPAGLTIDNTGLIAGTIDPGAAGSHSVTVTASANGSVALPMTFKWTVNAPVITLSTSLADAQVGVAYSATLTATGGTGPYTFALVAGALPAGLTLAPDGTVHGTPTAGGLFTFTARARDASTGSGPFRGTHNVTLRVTPPTFSIAALQSMQVSVAGKQTLAITGGTAPYRSVHVAAGQLPAGVWLAPTGVLYGTPTAGGSFTFTVRAADSSTGAGYYSFGQALTLTVAPPNLAITTTALPAVPARVTFSQTVQAGGGAAPFHFAVTAGALPPGVQLSAATGTLNGTPTTPGVYDFTIRVTDSSTGTGPYRAAQSLALVVQEATQLTFVAPVASSTTGVLAPFQVQVLDQLGNPFNGVVTLKVLNPSGTTSVFYPGSVTSARTVGGVATFNKVDLYTWAALGGKGPRSYQLVATAGLLTTPSNLFAVGAMG